MHRLSLNLVVESTTSGEGQQLKAIAAGTNKVLIAALLVLGFVPLSASEARIIGHTKARSS